MDKAINEKFTKENAAKLVSQNELVIDCTDNLESRYLSNQICFTHKTPLISAAIYNLEGNMFVSKAYDGVSACYQCSFNKNPDISDVKSCQSGPILGPVASVIGSLVSIEILKELAGGVCLNPGTLVLYDAQQIKFRKVVVNKKHDCVVCN